MKINKVASSDYPLPFENIQKSVLINFNVKEIVDTVDGKTQTTYIYDQIAAPENTDAIETERLLKEAQRKVRDGKLQEVEWAVERHRQQVELGVTTNLSQYRYIELLEYIQTLRDFPAQGAYPHMECPELGFEL